MKFKSKFASYLLEKCFIANTCLELCIIWENLDRDSWRLRTLSYISTNPWEFLFYSFFNQYKIKSWRKIKFLVNEGKNYLLKQSHGHSSHICLSPPENPFAVRDMQQWDNLKRSFSIHRGDHIVHLSQKENNPGISAFKIARKCSFRFFPQGISKNFFFENVEYSSYLLNGIVLNLLLLLRMWLLLMVWMSEIGRASCRERVCT